MMFFYVLIPIILAVTVWSFPADWLGWLIYYGTFAVVFSNKNIRSDKYTILIVMSSLVIRHILAFTNSYVGPTLGADADAIDFFSKAAGESILFTPGIGVGSTSKNYISIFYWLFQVTPASLFTMCEASVLAYALTIYMVADICVLLRLEQYKHLILFFIAFNMTSIFLTSIQLRESWQLLFLVASVYFFLRLTDNVNIRDLLACGVSLFCMGLLQTGLMLAMIVFAALYASYFLNFKDMVVTGVSTFIGIALIVVILVLGQGSATIDVITKGDVLEATSTYQAGASKAEGRSEYRARYSSGNFFIDTFSMLFFYQFAPLPWQVSGVKDIPACLEGLLKMAMVAGFFLRPKRYDKYLRRKENILFAAFWVVSFIFSLGTGTWGSSMRHGLVAYPLLVFIGWPPLYDKIKSWQN